MKHFLLVAFSSVIQFVSAQNLVPDPAFGTNGMVEKNFATGNNQLISSMPLQNGSIISAGTASNFTKDYLLTKVNATGAPDLTFGNQGYAFVDFFLGAEALKTLAMQTDGKILVGGNTRKNNVTFSAIARLTQNGAIDPSFGENGYLKFHAAGTSSFSTVESVKVLSDGKIIAAGYFLQSSVYKGFIRKYLSNGTLDSTFGTSGQATINFGTAQASSYIFDVILESDGKITVFGQNYTNRFLLGMGRLTSNGAPDLSFSADGFHTYSFTTGQNYSSNMYRLADGKYLISGYANSSTANYKVFTSRFSNDGNLDNAYGTSGLGTHSANASYTSCLGSALLPDESLLLVGEAYFTNIYHPVLYKVTPAGILESGFGTNGFLRINTGSNSGFGNSIHLAGGNFFVTGSVYSSTANSNFGLLVGFQNSGTPLPGFGANGQALIQKSNSHNRAKHLDKTANGQYLISGDLVNLDSDPFNARFNANGTMDNNFGSFGYSVFDFGTVEDYKDRVVTSNDNLVLLSEVGNVSLNFTGLGTFSGSSDYALVTSSNEGIQNATNKNFRFSNTEFTRARAIRKDPQGNIYVLANQSQPTRAASYLSKHLPTSFTLDNTFGTSGKYQLSSFSFPNDINYVDFQIDNSGTIYTLKNTGNASVSGFRIRKYDAQMQGIASFGNISGELVVEEAFSTAFGSNGLYLLANGLLVSGIKAGVASIARVSFDGALLGIIALPDFKSVSKIKIESDGSFYVSGMGQNNKFRLVKFLANGSPALDFNGTGFISDTYFANAISIQDFIVESGAGIVLLTRTQEGLEGEKVGLIRLIQGPTSTQEKIESANEASLIYPNPASEHIFWQSKPGQELEIISIIDASGKSFGLPQPSNGSAGINIQQLPAGKYWLSVLGPKERKQLPFVKK
jgi:uncharacterized delta-60 repeat protein